MTKIISKLRIIISHKLNLLVLAPFLFIFLASKSQRLSDVYIITAIMLAIYVTNRVSKLYLFYVALGMILIVSTIIVKQIVTTEKITIFVTCYFILYVFTKNFHFDFDDLLLTKLVRPIFMYENWPDIYKIILNKYQGQQIIYRLRNGVRFIANARSKDFLIIEETWGAMSYVKYGIQINPTDVVVDIGAYIGDFTIYASRMAYAGKVLAYEPLLSTFQLLSKNIELNKSNNVDIFNVGISETNKKIKLFVPKNAEFGTSMMDITKYGECVEVEALAISMREIITKNKLSKIDLLKIDCEGAEFEILSSTPKNIFSRIKQIVLEYHQLNDMKVTDLVELLQSMNYNVQFIPKNKYTGYVYAKKY